MLWARLKLKDTLYGFFVGWVTTQPPDGFGRISNNTASTNAADGLMKVPRVHSDVSFSFSEREPYNKVVVSARELRRYLSVTCSMLLMFNYSFGVARIIRVKNLPLVPVLRLGDQRNFGLHHSTAYKRHPLREQIPCPKSQRWLHRYIHNQ